MLHGWTCFTIAHSFDRKNGAATRVLKQYHWEIITTFTLQSAALTARVFSRLMGMELINWRKIEHGVWDDDQQQHLDGVFAFSAEHRADRSIVNFSSSDKRDGDQ